MRMRERFTFVGVALPAFFTGLVSAVFLLPFWVKPFLSAVEKGSPSDWIGFAGNVGVGMMTVIAASAALIAANIAIRPVYDQLREMVRQSDFASFGVLRKRAEDLNNERVLLYRVLSGAALITKCVDGFIDDVALPETGDIGAAIDRFEQAVTDLQNNAGNVWGSEQVQKSRIAFLDASFMAASNIMNINRRTPVGHPQRRTAFTSNRPMWVKMYGDLASQGTTLINSIEANGANAAKLLAIIEQRIFVG
jgi:hypothetical protein